MLFTAVGLVFDRMRVLVGWGCVSKGGGSADISYFEYAYSILLRRHMHHFYIILFFFPYNFIAPPPPTVKPRERREQAGGPVLPGERPHT